MTLNGGSSITGNAATASGGGIFLFAGTVTGATAANVSGNTPNNCAPPDPVPGCTG